MFRLNFLEIRKKFLKFLFHSFHWLRQINLSLCETYTKNDIPFVNKTNTR